MAVFGANSCKSTELPVKMGQIHFSPVTLATMNTSTLPSAAVMNEQDFDAIDQILEDLRTRLDEVPQWEFCEGLIAALVCCRRAIPASEYFSVLLSDPETGEFGPQLFADHQQYEQFLNLWQRRWHEIEVALDAQVDNLDDERAYAPEVFDVRGIIAAMSPEERAEMAAEIGDEELPYFAQVWALGFMFVVETWPEEWQAPRDKQAADQLEYALSCIIDITEDDVGEPVISMFGESSPPTVSQERINAYGHAIWAVYDLRELWKNFGPRVLQVIKADEPGRNDPCSCGSGKKYKKCCGSH